eukprot:EG_transcript_44266
MYELQHQSHVRRLLHQRLPSVRPLAGRFLPGRLYNDLVVSNVERLRSWIVEKVPSQGAVPFENATLALAFLTSVLYASIHTHPQLIERYARGGAPVPLAPATDFPLLLLLVHLLGVGLTVCTISVAAALAFLHLPIALRHASA